MNTEHPEASAKHLLTRVYATILIVSIVLIVIGDYMTHKYNSYSYGVIQCRGGFSHCAHLRPLGTFLAFGGLVTVVGFVTAGVSLVSLVVVLLSKTRSSSTN